MSFGAGDLLALNSLLTENQEENERSSAGNAGAITPASFGAPRRVEQEAQAGPAAKKKKDPKDIWDEDEVPPEEAILPEDVNDARPRPK